jgi:hypothetical protein
VGISIRNGVIKGRLELDAATGEAGGPICPLRFDGTCFEGGFSGANAHFSRVGFLGCRFRDPGADPQAWPPIPTIDLSGARFAHGLLLRAIEPEDSARDCLWIRAPDTRIAGPLDLSCSHLRAPQDDKMRRLISDAPVAGLDLARAGIAGDVRLLTGFTCDGRVYCLGMHVQGDLRMSGATITVGEKEGLNLQGARIDGMAVLDNRPDVEEGGQHPKRPFVCSGAMKLRAAEIGDDLHIETESIGGSLDFLDITVGNDLLLYARIDGSVDLSGCRVGGTLDLSRLEISPAEGTDKEKPKLLLCNGSIQRTLRLARDDFKEGQCHRSEFSMGGTVDLSGLSCETLEDDLGELWKGDALIHMHNFSYRRTGSLPERRRKQQSNRIFGDWLLRNRADGNRPWRWLPRRWLPEPENFRENWQIRRDWIYQQFNSVETRRASRDLSLSRSRHEIHEEDYHPQPFEQAIRVARAEGRENFAIQFEMHKERVEWRFFNGKVRWGLSVVGILLAALWLVLKENSVEWRIWIGICLVLIIIAMINTSKIHNFYRNLLGCKDDRKNNREDEDCKAQKEREDREDSEARSKHVRSFGARVLTWVTFFLAPGLLYIHGWRHTPFHFLVALLIYGVVRLLGVLAHAVMRFGFGYLRRPINAICTLIAAFVLGWWGVHVANSNEMLVVDAEPVATLVGSEAGEPAAKAVPALLIMGSQRATERSSLVHNVPCDGLISEPLYALDILIPLLDLREESRCEVRRIPVDKAPPKPNEMRGLSGVIEKLPDLTVRNNGFWAVMKVLYAILGWFIVSLAILTFAQVNKTHAEPSTEHR